MRLLGKLVSFHYYKEFVMLLEKKSVEQTGGLSVSEAMALAKLEAKQTTARPKTTDERDIETSECLTTTREKVSSRRFKCRADADRWFAELQLRAPLSDQIRLVREITKGKRGDVCHLRMVVFAEIATTKTVRHKLTWRQSIIHRDRASRRCSVARDANGSAISRQELISYVKAVRADLEADYEFRWRALISFRLRQSETGGFRDGQPYIVRAINRRRRVNKKKVGTNFSVKVAGISKEKTILPVIGITRDGWGCDPADKRCVTTRNVRHGVPFADVLDDDGEMKPIFNRALADSGIQCRPVLSSVAENPENWVSPIRHNRSALMPQAQFVELAKSDTQTELAEFLAERIPSRDAASSAIGRMLLANELTDSLSRGNSVRRAASICGVPESSLRVWLSEFGVVRQ